MLEFARTGLRWLAWACVGLRVFARISGFDIRISSKVSVKYKKYIQSFFTNIRTN